MTKLINQQSDWDCVIACFAMWLNVSYEDVVAMAKKDGIEGRGIFEKDEVLIGQRFGMKIMHIDGCYRDVPGIVGLGSLNYPGAGHAVFQDGDNKIFDPQEGRENKIFYSRDCLNDGSKTYCKLMTIDLNDEYSRDVAEQVTRRWMVSVDILEKVS